VLGVAHLGPQGAAALAQPRIELGVHGTEVVTIDAVKR
jgi:hypothetical protein